MATCVEQSLQEIKASEIVQNAAPARLYELGVSEEGASIVASGALATYSGEKTGRSPKDKRIVENPESKDDIWWGPVNMPVCQESFTKCRQQAIKFINGRKRVYVVDGYAGWDHEYRVKVRVISSLAYHALFMRNMLIRPSQAELKSFGEPDFVIYNAGELAADKRIPGISSNASVMLDLERKELVILGSKYAGEMKKGIFTAMNYWMPKQGVLSMHCSANEGPRGEVTLFFGLSGTGKTTLSSDLAAEADRRRRALLDRPRRLQHRGGLLRQVHRPDRRARAADLPGPPLRLGARERGLRPRDPRARLRRRLDHREHPRLLPDRAASTTPRSPAWAAHPKDIIFLTCDAFGVLPPVSRLTPAQAMYHFLSGYTAKIGGDRGGDQRAPGHLLRLLRRGVPGPPPRPLRRAAGRADEAASRPGLAGQHGLDRRLLRRRLADRS